MVDVKVIKLKVRRGLNSHRKNVVLDQGELGYTTDTERLFVGTGVLSGGLPAGAKVWPILATYNDLSGYQAEINDIAYAESKLYQLTASTYNILSSWNFIGTVPNNVTIEYNASNELDIVDNSVDGTKLDQQALSGSGIKFATDKIAVDYHTAQFAISANQLVVKTSGINSTHISTDTLSSGLIGGAGTPLRVNVDGQTIGFDGTMLTVLNSVSGVPYNKLVQGFNVDYTTNNVSTNVIGVDPNFFGLDEGIVTFKSAFEATVYDILSGDDTGVADLYNGSPNQLLSGWGGNPVLTYAALSGDSIAITLSSAGYIVINPGSTSTDSKPYTRLAIPVFTF